MGRTTASRGDARSASQKKDVRAKHAKDTINKIIPALLQSDARARNGVESAELIVDGAGNGKDVKHASMHKKATKGRGGKAGSKKGRRRNGDSSEVDEVDDKAAESASQPSDTFGATGERTSASVSSSPPFTVRILQCDTLTAAHALISTTTSSRSSKNGPNVAILNMASPLRPGGGVINGAVAQEESLCIRTTLYPSLKEEWYRLPEVGVIWTPNVLVFRDEEGRDLSKGERWYVDVVSAAALRFPDVVEDLDSVAIDAQEKSNEAISNGEDSLSKDTGNDNDSDGSSSDSQELVPRHRMRYASAKDRDLMVSKMTAVLKTPLAHGTTKVVLGAWGCGAYGNPVSEIAKAWKTALHPPTTRNWTNLKEVVFAIKEGRMAEDFAKEYGEDVAVEVVRPARAQKGSSMEVEDLRVKEKEELEQRIADLERQIEQTRFPELRERLRLVLESLKAQLGNFEEEGSE